jgi:phage shock protein PspC (stress-responsive transcriptional regulator)
VCGGLGEYLNVDPLFIRLGWVLMVLAGGFGILLYLVWVFIVPVGSAGVAGEQPVRSRSLFGAIVGGGLILLGVSLLLDEWNIFPFHHIWDWSWRFAGPALLIIGGAYLITRRTTSSEPTVTAQNLQDRPAPERPGRPQFRKSRNNKKIFGVCGGLAEYFDVDPTLVRLGVAGVTLAAPPFGIIGYLALAILAPTAEAEPVPPAQPTAAQG